jgi:hypothetical protein
LPGSGEGQTNAVERPESPRSEVSHGHCSLCEWSSPTVWELGEEPPLSALFDWAAHVRLEHPVVADWLAPALSGIRQN